MEEKIVKRFRKKGYGKKRCREHEKKRARNKKKRIQYKLKN